MSKIDNLRSFLTVLENAGRLVHIERSVDLEYELADVAAALERRRGPASLFKNVSSSQSPEPAAGWPIFASAVTNQTRAALALECEKSEVVEVMRRALKPADGVPPVRVDDAAWKAHVVTGDEIDLRRLPIPTHAAGDGGAFVTGGVTISKDPVGGRGNLSYQRMLGHAFSGAKISGRSRLGPRRTSPSST